jgi:hypothetical protein
MILEAASFTAARDLDPGSGGVIVNVLVQVPAAQRYVTGGARGGDAFIGAWLAQRWPSAVHTVVLPANRSQTDPWWERSAVPVQLIEMPPGTAYKDRNAELVRLGTAVFGLPAHEENDPRSRGSGTWQTIRMARRAQKMSMWACVKPPYHGQVERWPSEFAGTVS